jgi:hypothetical protein
MTWIPEATPGIGGGKNKGEWWRGWIQLEYIWYILRTFVNGTMYPQHNNFKKRKKNQNRKALRF